MIILLDAKPKDVEIVLVALNLLERHPLSVFQFHRPVVGAKKRCAVTLTHIIHTWLGTIGIEHGLNFARRAESVVHHEDVFRVIAQVVVDHVLRLQVNRQGSNEHNNGHGVLHHDDDGAIHRFGFQPQ